MTPKEKAEELIKSFTPFSNTINGDMNWINAKHSALIAVDELIEEHTWANPISWNNVRKKYWNEVKSEIEKL